MGVDLAGATIRNIARGVLGIASIQALLVGLGLIVAGVPAAGLLTLVALVLCILQIGLTPLTAALAIWAWFHYATLPALLFLGQPVRVLSRQRPHEPRLAVVDVARRSDR